MAIANRAKADTRRFSEPSGNTATRGTLARAMRSRMPSTRPELEKAPGASGLSLLGV